MIEKNIRQLIHRTRNSFDKENNPKSRAKLNEENRENIVIPDESKDFTLANSGQDDKSRVICFGYPRNIRKLNENHDWYGDGTFNVSPLSFKQLFTLNIINNGETQPLVYALLPNKNQATYVKMFKLLVKIGLYDDLGDALSFSTDFEKAILNAVQLIFNGVRLLGCYFHYTQNLGRNVQMKELIQYYSSSLEFHLSFNKFKALAFVLTKDASKAFDLIKNDCPVEFSPMLEYFETWYIGHRKPNSHHCLKPAFHELWSVYNRTLNEFVRTNNKIESWHKQFEVD